MDREGRAWEQARSARDEVRWQVATSGENGRRGRLDLLRAPVAGRFVRSKGDPGANEDVASVEKLIADQTDAES